MKQSQERNQNENNLKKSQKISQKSKLCLTKKKISKNLISKNLKLDDSMKK